MIHFDKVTKIYSDDTVALDEVDFSIAPGELLSIVGHSGAGKTTLLKLILAEEFPTEGSVYYESTDVHSLNSKEVINYRRRLGVVFQDCKLLSNKTAYENITFAMEASGRSDIDIQSDTPEVLELVGLSDKMWNFPFQLSGGEKQRVAIARAIVNQPDIILADEPTGNLDPLNAHEVIQILKKINDLGTTVILTTHNKGVVDGLARRVLTLDNGRIIRDDKKGRYIL